MKLEYKILTGMGIGTAIYFVYKHFNGRIISKKGIEFLTLLEGKRNKMYLDSKQLPTIGVGHLIKPSEKILLTKTLTDKEVQKLFDKDLDRFEAVVKNTIKVPISQWQKDALVSIAFNIGETGFKNSTLAKLINSKASDQEVIKAFSAWDKPSVLRERRAKEARLFTTGNYSPYLAMGELNKYYKA